jgi:eukaryotic-like serine/threonine-protein kinase
VAAEARNVKKPTPFGKYFLLERINIGGMAEVFRAKAFGVEGFERLVAVKRILPNIAEDKEFIRMFIEEAKLSVQLNHANIAQIFDLGVVDGAYYIALEHVHGRDLRGIFDRCRQLGSTMPIAQACFVVMKLCEGLDYAHNKRDQSGRELSLVHRDVSPQNVLVSFEGEVKIIDFGIAKAAGKGSKTQAGILKGKFGYMSPEQVRGLPVDRRSDVFSCGIVLYELLTGERLFVGESDFSTLEKVRNVEILPPSTYNRKIPDELERIVLKALAKDVEDRYQNAIDLHDELQAFVYTAGEFYSRKDLAGWMKKTFGREIEEETAKLESYRQLKPPASEAAAPPRPTGAGKPVGPPRRTAATPAVGAPRTPPPPPVRISQQVAALAAPSASGGIPAARTRRDDAGDLSWDDDELETQIYDNPEDDPRLKAPGRSKALPLQPPAAAAVSQPMAAAGASGAMPAAPGEGNPDLSSLLSTAKGWEAGPGPGPAPSPASTLNGIGPSNGKPKLATGSNQVASPGSELPPGHSGGIPALAAAYESGPVAPIQAPPMSGPMAAPASVPPHPPRELFDSMASYSRDMPARRGSARKGIVLMVVGGAAIAAVAVAVALVVTRSSGGSDRPAGTAAGGAQVAAQTPAVADQDTGFDLYVTPAGIMQWKLDGETRTDRLPSRIRGIAPGVHRVQIDAPPGFLSQAQRVEVVAGRAERVDIKLEPIPGIHGVFESNPPGATVSLIIDGKRQELGPSPARAPLDPRHTYQVLFEKPGFVSVNKPIVFTGVLEEKLAVALEKASVAAEEPPKVEPPRPTRPTPPTPPRTDPPKVGVGPRIDPPKADPPKADPPKVDPPKATGTGTLAINSKPSCEIYVDGASTGLYTPQPAMKLPAGKRRITLVNNEFGIKESFAVEISPDKPARMIKDYTDRLPK